jgi:hypothetical protein
MKPFEFYSKESIARNLEVTHHEGRDVGGEERASGEQEGIEPEMRDGGGEERASGEQEGVETEMRDSGGEGGEPETGPGSTSKPTPHHSLANETAEDPVSDQRKGSKRKRASGGSQPKKQPNPRPKRNKATSSPADESEAVGKAPKKP